MKAMRTGNGRRVRASRGSRPAVALALAALLAGRATAAETQAPHGALAMDAQQALLDGLIPKDADPAAAIDPVVWKSIVPGDNEMNADRVALGRKLCHPHAANTHPETYPKFQV